jgi:D-alanyl-D-alanine carboxypeptidase (penicillin-binding protein 5/6)
MNQKMRVVTWIFLGAVFWLQAASHVRCETGPEPSIQSEAAVLMDGRTGRVLFAENPEKRFAPASLAKMMTLYLVFDALKQGDVTLDQEVVVSERAWKMGGTQMFLEVGDRVQLIELIKGVAVISANDGALAIAEFLAGSEEAFVERMNEMARALGMRDTLFVSPHGLPREGQYTSAAGMATLGFRYVKAYPEALKFHALPTFAYGGIKQKNWNALLREGRGVTGLKTGYLKISGYHVVFSAQEDDQSLVGAVLGGATPEIRNQDARDLLEYGFDHFSTRAAVTEGEVVVTVEVPNGDPPDLDLTAATTVMVRVRKGRTDSVPLRKEIPATVEAPISRGSTVGKLVLEGEGFPRQEIDLVASQDIAVKSYTRYYWIGLAVVVVLLGIVLVKHLVSGRKGHRRFSG